MRFSIDRIKWCVMASFLAIGRRRLSRVKALSSSTRDTQLFSKCLSEVEVPSRGEPARSGAEIVTGNLDNCCRKRCMYRRRTGPDSEFCQQLGNVVFGGPLADCQYTTDNAIQIASDQHSQLLGCADCRQNVSFSQLLRVSDREQPLVICRNVLTVISLACKGS